MGYFLLYESMLDSVLFARNKWLKPDGIMMPNRAKMFVAALDDEAYYTKKLNYWNNVYGVSMKCMKKWVLSEPIVDPIDHQDILSNTMKFYDIDLEKILVADLDFNSMFNIKIEIDGWIHGFVSWFDCDFSHGKNIICLSTSPYKKQTHWKQTVFYLDKPIQVSPGDAFEGTINVVKAKENPRELNVRI